MEDKELGARLVEVAVLAGAAAPEGLDATISVELKLRSGDAQGAFDAAKGILGEGTGDASVLLVRAVKAGAVVPEDLDCPPRRTRC